MIRELATAEREHARALLAANDLPIDLDEVVLYGAFASSLIGVIGLQRFDEVGLLRSLVVEPSARKSGVAKLLCEHVFALGVPELWLLTTSAERFFTRLGFATTARDLAPPAIRATSQFSSLCPSGAALMRR